MAPHHDDRERHGSHPLAEFDGHERFHSEDVAERLEMDRATPAAPLIPFTWSGIKELAYVVTVTIGLSGGYYGLKSDNQELAHTIEAIAVRVTLIEKDRAVKVPEFEEMKRLNGLQDQRLQNLTEANGRTATSGNDLGRVVDGHSRDIADLRVRQAVMEERIGRGVPHDR